MYFHIVIPLLWVYDTPSLGIQYEIHFMQVFMIINKGNEVLVSNGILYKLHIEHEIINHKV